MINWRFVFESYLNQSSQKGSIGILELYRYVGQHRHRKIVLSDSIGVVCYQQSYIIPADCITHFLSQDDTYSPKYTVDYFPTTCKVELLCSLS